MKRKLPLICLMVCISFCSCAQTNYNDDVVVSIASSNTFSVVSSNPLTIKKGEDASFELSFNEGYVFESASNGVFDDNCLLVKNVMYSQTITIFTTEIYTVTLLVETDSHFAVKSANPVAVKKGQNASFDVELEDGYKFEKSDNYVYNDGKLIFSNIQQSYSVIVKTIIRNMFSININNDNQLGHVVLSPNKNYYDEGEMVNITITPTNDNKYICLSEEKGIHVLNNSSKPFSFKKSINLRVTRDYNFVVNYHNPEDYLMEYVLNGGCSFEGEETILFDYRLFGLRIRPNSLVNDSYILRDGYYLESYNTMADGSGTRIGIGSRIDTELFSEKYIKLYCQWIKETDTTKFEYESLDDGVNIISYLGDDENVVIPKTIENKEVVTINAHAFKFSNLKKVYLPSSIKNVEDNAFQQCAFLEELHFWTSLESVFDNSFVDCNNLKTIAINCSTYPKYLNSSARGNYADKLDHAELLAKTKPSILAVGSSTLQYNHSFKTMEEALNNLYGCYNLACLFAMPLQLMYDLALTIAGEDDYVLIQLHETQAARITPVHTMVYAYLEGDMDRFLMLNYQNHKKYMLSSWGVYKSDTASMNNQMSYEYCDRGLKENGDYVWGSDESKITDDNRGSGTLSISRSYKYSNFEYLANIHDFHNQKNTLLTFDTYNKNAIEDLSSFYDFENFIKTNFDSRFEIITNMDDSVIEGKYFRYQDNIHLNSVGGLNHCSFLGGVIKNLLLL